MSEQQKEQEDIGLKRRPYLMTLVGGKSGIGTTSCLMSLASALVSARLSTLVISSPDSILVPKNMSGETHMKLMRSFMTGAGSISTVIDETDSGFFLLPSLAPVLSSDLLTTTRAFISKELATLDRFDLVIMDGGNVDSSSASKSLSAASDLLVMVVDSHVDSMRRAYAFVKSLIAQAPVSHVPEMALIINRAISHVQAIEVGEQFVSGVARFLDRPSRHFGTIDYDPSMSEAVSDRSYFISHPYSDYAQAVNEIAKNVQQYHMRFISSDMPVSGIDNLRRSIEQKD